MFETQLLYPRREGMIYVYVSRRLGAQSYGLWQVFFCHAFLLFYRYIYNACEIKYTCTFGRPRCLRVCVCMMRPMKMDK